MSMSQEYNDLKEFVRDQIAGYQAMNESQMFVTNNHLQRIDNHLCKLNGKVEKHEKLIQEGIVDDMLRKKDDENRAANCPQLPRIQRLEEDKKIRIGVKQLIVGTLVLVSLMVSIAFTTVKLAEHLIANGSVEQTE